jgi:uncharacterized repeat protein (TIGR01451 family)
MVTTITPASAATVKVTFVITKIIQPFSSDIDGTPGDFYANVNIDDQGVQSSYVEECSVGIVSCVGYTFPYEVGVNFKFTRDVDLAKGTIPIRVSLVDSDFFVNPDDFLDVNPVDGKFGLLLYFNMNTGTWSEDSGGIPDNQGFSSGPTEEYDENGSATIFFEIAVDYDGDFDEDGIPNGIERFGIRDDNGDVIPNTNGFGFPMDPCRKTVAVEVDYMDLPGTHTHQPLNPAIQDAVDMFNNAPVATNSGCPYPGFPTQATGMNLVVDVDDALAHEVNTDEDDFEAIRDSFFTEARRPYFIYNAWVHNLDGKGSQSGISYGGYGGTGFVVSLGLWTPLNGDRSQQLGTFVHELGHSLGLDHGGDDPNNCKANYLSVMNYNFSPGVRFRVPNPSGGTMFVDLIDYSRDELTPELDESSLNENVGIGAAGTYYANAITIWDSDGVSPWRNRAPQTTSEGPLDWDGDGTIEADVEADLDDFASMWKTDCLDNGIFALPTDGFDDWAYLETVKPAQGAGALGSANDIKFEEYQSLVEAWTESASMDLKVTKSVDQSNALPGDTLTYTVVVENIGSGPATGIVLVDTFPDGTTETRNLAEIEPRSSITEIFTYDVPFSSSGQTITNHATGTGLDLLGNPDADEENDSSEASTVIANFCGRPISQYNLIVGTAGDDTLKGGNGRNLILGLGGDDTITGGNEADCLIGGSGDGIIYGLNGNDFIAGNHGDDGLYGGEGNDVISGGAGSDTIQGNNGNDRIDGNDGDDDIAGGLGGDTIDGGNGTDSCAGNAGKNSIANCSP